jgi:hypothetical protein
MFNSEFYPTPKKVIEELGLDVTGKIILEPHAGSGNFLDYFKEQGAKQILCCELDQRLAEIAKTKGKFLKHDFFKVVSEEISHIDMIVMNPPFSNADKHIFHAWEIAPEGCEIVSLCNYETIAKDYRYSKLNKLIDNYGNSYNLGDCFSQAERKTGVEVGLVKLYKPRVSKETDYSGFFLEDDEEEYQENGVMHYNEVRALVNRYVGAMKTFDLLKQQQENLNYNLQGLGIRGLTFQAGHNEIITDKETFGKLIQIKSWKHIFHKMKIEKYVTKGVMDDINKFVETQTKIPFTMKNIYKMFDIIIGTRDVNFNKALEEVIDNFTRHTHENRYAVEGWKTNSGYMLNKKFITGWCVETSYSGNLQIKEWNSNFEKITDLVKVLCNLTGTNYDNIKSIKYSPCDVNEEGYLTTNGTRVRTVNDAGYSNRIMHYDSFKTNTWYEWAFFEFKVFKKGTMHLKFKNDKDWYLLNQAYGKLKGFTLPNKI